MELFVSIFKFLLQVQFQYPEFYLLPIVIGAVLLSLWFYQRFRATYESPSVLVYLLRILRAGVLVLLAILLLVPFVRFISSRLEKPIVAIGLDNSNSMKLVDSAKLTQLQAEIDRMSTSLENKYEVESFVFGDDVSVSDWDFEDKRTDINEWLRFVSKRYKHGNLGGVITVSDGIFNSGGNPTYGALQLTAPMHAVALGDTTTPVDIRLSYVNHNNIAYQGNQFPIKVGVEVEKLKGENLALSLRYKGKVLKKEPISVSSDHFFREFTFIADAEEVGIQKYSLSLESREGELSLENNAQDIFIEVIDADKNVLIAYKSPHPDVAALRKSIERNKNYAVELFWVNGARDETPDFSKYHLIILHNLPQRGNNTQFNKIMESGTSLLFVHDQTVNFKAFNQSQSVVEMKNKSNTSNQVFGVYNKSFVGYGLKKVGMVGIKDYPPLKAAFQESNYGASHDVLLYQKIGSVNTGYPLLTIAEDGPRKIGHLAATGIWRWFLYEYSKNGTNETMDELMGQTVQYLATKEDKRRLKLIKNKYLFRENESVSFAASFYDKNYQPARDGRLSISIKNEEGKDFRFDFISRSDIFELNAGQMAPGEYEYSISAELGAEVMKLSGKFTVAEVNVEYMQPVADHNLLFQLSSQYNGELYEISQLKELEQKLLNNEDAVPIRHETADITELIHNKWLFFLILSLLSIEWIIRKYKGAY